MLGSLTWPIKDLNVVLTISKIRFSENERQKLENLYIPIQQKKKSPKVKAIIIKRFAIYGYIIFDAPGMSRLFDSVEKSKGDARSWISSTHLHFHGRPWIIASATPPRRHFWGCVFSGAGGFPFPSSVWNVKKHRSSTASTAFHSAASYDMSQHCNPVTPRPVLLSCGLSGPVVSLFFQGFIFLYLFHAQCLGQMIDLSLS